MPDSAIDILIKLEEIPHPRIPARKVQAQDLDTVRDMLAAASRHGKPTP